MNRQLLKDVMTPAPETLRLDSTIEEAALMMREHDTGFLPIVENDVVEGVITDRDIVVRGVAEGIDVAETDVSEIMTEDYHALYEDQTLDEALELMEAQQIRRLLVLDRSAKVCGVVSLGDLAVRAERGSETDRVFERVSVPKMKKPPNEGARPRL